MVRLITTRTCEERDVILKQSLKGGPSKEMQSSELFHHKEIVIDGTDCSGKTPMVETVRAKLDHSGYHVVVLSPFRVREVFPLWATEPVRAAQIIDAILEGFRKEHSQADFLLFDRGWPTVYVSTANSVARDCITGFPAITVMLLNYETTIIEKINKYNLTDTWLTDDGLRKRFITAYNRLAADPPVSSLIYRAKENGRFDLDAIADQILRRSEEFTHEVYAGGN